ncbi:MAG: hypothetical protein ACE5EG_10175 [Thermoanaerobaculia bacterium]
MNDTPAVSHYPFRPWVRSTCRRAMIWGVGVVGLLGLVAWLFRTPGSAPLGRAFGVLAGYGLLFWLTLLKVWWTAGQPAVEVNDEGVAYQPLHTFRPRRTPWERVLASAPRAGTQSLRLVVRKPRGGARELFLNLAVIRGQHRLLDQLDRQLGANGLLPIPGREHAWRRPEWVEVETPPGEAGDRA